MHSCQLNKASNCQILEKKNVKIVKDGNGNRKKIVRKNKYLVTQCK